MDRMSHLYVMCITLVGLCLNSLPLTAQTAKAPAEGNKLTLKEGTDVKLRFAETLSSKTASDGDPVSLVLEEDLSVGDVVVARSGAKVHATVTNAKKAGMMGKGGELALRLEYMRVGDTKVRLRGTRTREGEDKTTTAIVLTVLLGPLGLIKHGKNIEIKQGTELSAFVDDDVALPPAPPSSAP